MGKPVKLHEILKEYFENTPREEVLAMWKRSDKCDEVGETADSFIKRMESFNKDCECLNCKNCKK